MRRSFCEKKYFKLGIVIAHEGYIIDKTNLIHASSEYNRTVNVDFLSYLLMMEIQDLMVLCFIKLIRYN